MAKTFDKANVYRGLIGAARRRPDGFTLIEMMIVVCIIAILAAIAIPAYKKQIMQSRESSAKSALLDLARREETFYSTNNYYTAEMATLGYAGVTSNAIKVPNNSNEAYYSVTITAPASGGTTAATFTATAAPVAGSTQTSDPCGTYQIDYLGNQTNSGGTGTTSGGLSCW
ncbi:prepilin-type N-terminal cleavage/methylation domain-containing protein [Dyella sp. M7H15-1]|uniref:type IV pilin protein n=1 Tax=Dyella sp. M7H15-1 TaxID=2501295 RepID=UPI001004D7BF|nr:type IV pilin protein [Dyella sp. M7H15-1]QAU24266.1 prepilin-type N-terminal cleavage/methylation domain-containing protein [Dyella sp. M7H15-1]